MSSEEGLFGSNTAANLPRVTVAEFLGTFLLVLAGTAVAVSAVLKQPTAGAPADSLAVALTFGAALAVLAVTFGHISGCHLNPAVTIALAVVDRFPWKYVLPYVLAQLAGAISASLVVLQFYGQRAKTDALLGATQPSDGVSDTKVFFIEMTVTFFLVLVIIAVATDKRVPAAVAAPAIGLVLYAGIMIAGPLTGGGVNPARALGTMIVAGRFVGVIGYTFGPILGGILAALLYDDFFRGAEDPSEAEQP